MTDGPGLARAVGVAGSTGFCIADVETAVAEQKVGPLSGLLALALALALEIPVPRMGGEAELPYVTVAGQRLAVQADDGGEHDGG